MLDLLPVGLSLYLGFFAPAGVGFCWIVSNLMSIAFMYILDYFNRLFLSIRR